MATVVVKRAFGEWRPYLAGALGSYGPAVWPRSGAACRALRAVANPGASSDARWMVRAVCRRSSPREAVRIASTSLQFLTGTIAS